MKNELYRELKQYIHNEMGITKEDIRDMIRDCVKEEVEAIFKDGNNYNKYIATLVNRYVKDNKQEYATPRFTLHKPHCLDQVVYDEVVREVSKTVKERVLISLTEAHFN